MSVRRLARPLIGLAFRGYRGWMRLTGRPLRGASVALWHGGQLLVVRHSYRPGYCLPGGLLRRGEDPRLAACREIREELGIAIPPRALQPIADEPVGRHHEHLYEYRPAERPQVRIDDWEIIEAEFVDPGQLASGDYQIGGNLRRARWLLSDGPSGRAPARS